MNGLSAGFLELEPKELVRFLLRETGQFERDSVDTTDLLDYLGLRHLCIDFEQTFVDDFKHCDNRARPRALLSFGDRVVATDFSLIKNRTRFSILHEIGHYILPDHEHSLYLCDDLCLSLASKYVMEKEASGIAADLLFLGDRFSLDANSQPLNATTVKTLAGKYHASFEATARRLVEKRFKPCMLVIFQEESKPSVETDSEHSSWVVKYCVASASFKARYFDRINGHVPPEIVAVVTMPGRDISNSHINEMMISSSGDRQSLPFQAEFFCNTYNIFCILKPVESSQSV